MSLALRAAVALRLNLNWLFDPRTAWQRGEPLRMPKGGMASPPSEIARLFAGCTAARAEVRLQLLGLPYRHLGAMDGCS